MKFEKMNRSEVQIVRFEIAFLGQRGINPKDATTNYELKSIPREFAAPQLYWRG